MRRHLFLLALASFVSPDPFHWHSCLDSPADPDIQCGFLTVPLDHRHPNDNRRTIDIVVRRVRVPHSVGTIVLNPGGPGVSGALEATHDLADYLGGTHDILGFDPRGVGASRQLRCPPVPSATLALPIDVPATRRIWKTLLNACAVRDGAFAQYMSTALVARDMDLIRAALGDPVLHYFGVSYGTYLGITYANMFPDRVGRFVLDSIVDPTVFAKSTFECFLLGIPASETIFQDFVTACEAAGPTKCALADASATRPYLARRIVAFVASMDKQPMHLPSGDILTGNDVRSELSYYPPSMWPPLASQLSEWMAGKGFGTLKYDMQLETNVYLSNDSCDHAPTDLNATMAKATASSPLLGPARVASDWQATLWTTSTAIERFAGPWNATLRQRIVLLHTKVDPNTPLKGAYHLAAVMGEQNAVLVTRDGYGHVATQSEPSECLDRVVTDFFNHGMYPAAGTNCPVDETPFGLFSWPLAVATS
ncbi:Aste57867_17246 [Aphanomyces stellatus]|uniref:Aste57867_17246 protein n=1 Tax=Aphanomyces stellatus TaxID=120398 RepID=A0A485L960_9STRA|nr:hypothetical protein As57867_017187 [Aphanomyces stellatus]VFT94002.1 Aste57867_17246 [Aphanomyces stellatus]